MHLNYQHKQNNNENTRTVVPLTADYKRALGAIRQTTATLWQIQQLYERYKQNQTLSKEEYNLLSPYLAEMPADLSEPQAQNRTIGTGGTPQTNLVATAYNFSQAVQTYTPITGGTVLGTGTGVDDNNYTAQAIGFTFNYDGVDYTTLGVNANGFIFMGPTTPTTGAIYTPISTTSTSMTNNRIISALGGNLRGGSSGELRIETIGTAPNRICVVQWTNFQHYLFTPVPGDDYNFQIRLYETSNRIELHYGSFTKNATDRFYQVGLRGTSNADFNNRRIDWNNSANGTANNQNLPLTTASLPNNGRVFKFTPTNTTTPEVALTNIYSLGRVGIPLGNPVPIGVRVQNMSNSAVTVDLTVTVKNLSDVVRYNNTQTGLNIPANSAQVVNFSGWNPTIVETDSIVAEATVTSGTELDQSDNRIAFRQVITNNTFSYAQEGQFQAGGVGFNATTGNFVARFSANPSGNINQVGVNFTATGTNNYRIGIWNDAGGTPGALIWESGNLSATIGLNTIPVSPAVNVTGDFFVGVRQIATTNVGFAYQSESPIRSNTFYSSSPLSSTTWTDFSTAATPFRVLIEPRFQLPNDVGATAVTAPANNVILPVGVPINISATVFNYGSASQTPDVFYNINNGTPVGPVSAGLLASGASTTVTFSGSNAFTPSAPGTYTIKVFTAHSGDGDAANDTAAAITIQAQTVSSLPYHASLNDATAPGWTVLVTNAVSGPPIYTVVSGQVSPATGVTRSDGSSGRAVRVNFFNAQANRVEILRTPLISLSGTTNPILNFDVAYRSYTGQNDRIEVVVSIDGGATYLVGSPVLYNKARNTTPSLATLENNTANFTPGAVSHWRHETVDLSQFAGQTDLLIGFRATSAFGNNAWIANVTIQDVPTLTTTNVTGNGTFTGPGGITITFTNFGNPPGANLYFSRFNSPPTSDAPTEYATNTSATAPDGTIFTPNVAAPRWWTVTYDNQTLGATINYDVSIDYTGIPGINNPDKLYILRRSNRFGSWVALSTTRSGTVLTATGLTGFSDFVIGGDNIDNPLPVNLSAFTGRNIAQGVELRWQTASETDNAGFEVRRTELINGVEQEWLTIASYQTTPSLAGQGTTSQAHNYTYTDAGVQVGKTYRYALRSVDLNGTVHDYPQTVTVEVNTLAPKVYTYKLEQNYPNPFNPSTRIIYQVAAATNVKLEVFDMLGRKVATLVNERKDAGEYSVNFNASGLSSGVYFYRLQTDKFTQTKKLMLVK